MKRIGNLVRPLTKPIGNARGIAGISDWKFYLVFLLYGLSFICFLNDPFFRLQGKVVFQQGMITLLFAVILLNTVYWDFQLFGKPSGGNLFLQVFSYLPGGMLAARVLGDASKFEYDKSAFAKLWSIAEGTIHKIGALELPLWLTDIVSNWKITIALVLLLVILSSTFHKAFKIGALCLFLFVAFVTEMTSKSSSGHLIVGAILFAIGLCLQSSRYDYVVYFERIDESLRQNGNIDSLLLRCIMRIMSRLYQDSQLSEKDIREIVLDVYNTGRGHGNEYNDMELNQIAAEVSRKMIHSFNLVNIQQSSTGSFMYPNRHLYIYDSILRGIAVWPRVLAVGLFAILWTISPIDIIPDALPFIGTFDDVLAGLATTLMLTSTIKQEANIVQKS